MEFDIQGNLKPYDIIYTDWQTFKAEFVDAFPRSSTRQVIFANFSDYMEKLVAIIGTDFHQWVDGSFVTTKTNPGDIDFVTFVDAGTYYSNERKIDILRAEYLNQEARIDEYFIKQYPKTHRKYEFYHMDMLQWYNQFTRSRALKSKGFVQLNF